MKPVSTKNLNLLPEIDNLKKLLQSLATLDLIMSPEWEDRYYSFNSKWYAQEQMASMRNGCGDSFFVLFTPEGCFFKGFSHESIISSWNTKNQDIWLGLLDGIPDEFSEAKKEPAFSMDDISFCFWRRKIDSVWDHGPISFPEGNDPDGSEFLLECMDGDVASYKNYAKEYYEQDIPLKAIQHVYTHLPLTEKIVNMLNPNISLSALIDELSEIGYPSTEKT